MESHLTTALGESIENPTITDIKAAIANLQTVDDEHDAFWVEIVNGEQNAIEVHKDLSVFGMFEEFNHEQRRIQVPDWQQVEKIFALFLGGDLPQVKSHFPV